MKAIIAKGFGSRMHLALDECSEPQAGDDDVLVKVHAASVNPKDVKLNFKLSQWATPVGARLAGPVFGDDLAGEVVSVGRDVNDFTSGDRVYGMDMRPRTASLAEYAVINQRRIAKMPSTIGSNEAAAAPLAVQTALQGLRKAHAESGSAVLIIGASGGVGTYAVQVAKIMGCHVTAVCSSRNIELVQSLGADEVIDYTAADYQDNAGPFDIIFDVTSYQTPSGCAQILRPRGRFISTAGNGHALKAVLLERRIRAAAIRVESHTQDLELIADWVDTAQVRSVIDSCYSLAQSQQAYERSSTRRARGKIVIEVAASNKSS